MNFLGRFSIRTRVYFGTVFSLILLVVIGAMVYVALDRTRGTLQELFAERVQTLTDMSELRTTLGDLRRTEKDIIINFNNSVEVSALRESWAKTLASLRKRLADVRQVQSGDAEFVASIDKSLDEIKQYETGISPIFEKIEAPSWTARAVGPTPIASRCTWRRPTSCSPALPARPALRWTKPARASNRALPPCRR